MTLDVDWGDGTSPDSYTLAAGASTFSEQHTYTDDNLPAPGYTVAVTLSDNYGDIDTQNTTAIVSNVPPTLGAISVCTSNEGSPATLTGTFTHVSTQDAFQVQVDWGDGDTDTLYYPPGANSFSDAHCYGAASSGDGYPVSVTLTDADGATATASTTAVVNDVPPTLSNVAITPSTILENGDAVLSGSIAQYGWQQPLTLNVTWGDGANSTYTYPAGTTTFQEAHCYVDDNPTGSPSGVYTVGLSLSDGGSRASTAQASVTVDDAQPVLAGVAIVSTVNVGEKSVLQGMVQNIGPDDGFKLDVNWGDGTGDQIQSYPAGTQSFALGYAYADAGDYTVTVKVTDNQGDTATASPSPTAEVDSGSGGGGGGGQVVSVSPAVEESDGSSNLLKLTITSTGTGTYVGFTLSGTAVEGTDYDLVYANGDPVTWPLGVFGSTNVYIQSLDPLPAWSDKTVVFTLESVGSGYTASPTAGCATVILDAPALPEVSFDSSTIQQEVTENGNPAGIDVTFEVDVSKAFAQATDVYFNALGTAVQGEQADYTLPGEADVVPFAAGQTEADLVVHVNCDDVADGDKKLTLALNAGSGAPYTLAPLEDEATLTIHDGAPTVSIDEIPPVAEGDTADLTVRLSSAVPYAVTVEVQPEPGTASPDDYDGETQTVVFPANTTSEPLYVQTYLDSAMQSEETFDVELTCSQQAHIDPSNDSATVTIEPVKAQLTVDDGNGNAVPHNEQLNPGGLVFLQGPGGLLADAVPMTVTVVDPPSLTQPAGGQLELAYSSKLEIYKTDGTLVASGSTLLPFASTTLLVVGVNASATFDDANVDLYYVLSGSEDLPLDHAAYTVEQVKLMMSVAGSPAVDIANTSAPPVIVGQMIKLSVVATPDPGGLAWIAPELPGQVVQNYTQTLASAEPTPYFPGGYTANPVSFAWIAATDGSVNVETTSDLWDSHYVSASFDVVSPTATLGSTTNPVGVTVGPVTNVGTALCFGDANGPDGTLGIYFTGQVTAPVGGAGQIACLQMICGSFDATTVYNQPICISMDDRVLDNVPDPNWLIPQCAVAQIAGSSTQTIKDSDAPYLPLEEKVGDASLARASFDLQFKTYLMYKPAGASVWVTLQLLRWDIAGEAVLTGRTGVTPRRWILVPGSGCPPYPPNPQGQPSTTLPEWSNYFKNLHWQIVLG